MPDEDGGQERGGRRLRRLLLTAVVFGMAILLAMSTLTALLVARSQEATRRVEHTYQVERLISEVRVSLSRAESSRRGYLITREQRYIDRFDQSATELPKLQGGLRALTSDNPVQQANAQALEGLLTRKLQEQEASLQRVQAADLAGVDMAAMVRENQATLDQLRDLLNAMMAEEDRLLSRRAAAQAHEAEALVAVVMTSGVILALLAAGSFLLLRRYAEDLGRSQLALRALNAGLEEEVARRTAELTRANEEIQRFAYIVSHDLRSPLVNVMGFTSELETAARPLNALVRRLEAQAPDLLTREAREAVALDLPESIGFIRSSTEKMDRLINAILRLSREGRRTLSPEAVDMDAMVAGIIASLHHESEAKGAALDIEGGLPALVNDRLALEQVFSNVIENALKYLKPGRPGRVSVRGRTEGPTRIYEVQDNGRGIDPRDHARVFELFRRAGVQDQPGEGIGLAHVQALVRRLGGSIRVDSELDRGATFRICLPARLSAAPEPP